MKVSLNAACRKYKVDLICEQMYLGCEELKVVHKNSAVTHGSFPVVSQKLHTSLL